MYIFDARYLCSLLLLVLTFASQAQTNKIESALLKEMQNAPDNWHKVYILLEDQVDVAALHQNMKKANLSIEERAKEVLQVLQAKANETQPTLLSDLSKLLDVQRIQPYWITNAIAISAKVEAIRTISKWASVESIESIPKMILFDANPPIAASLAPENSEPGLRAINAHKLWRLGYTGYGQTILVIDSGQNGDHPALKTNFLGNNMGTALAWTGTNRPDDCGFFHGTHVTGIAVGIDRAINDTIGVAPNAEWLGSPLKFEDCDLGQYGFGTFDPLAHLQWALNPDGNANTSTDIPDVINNSWGTEQSTCNQSYRNTLLALEAAGVAVVWATGNSGPDTRTTGSPASLNMSIVNAFAVGSIDSQNEIISDFSSRGPTSCSGLGALEIKPEVVAPGQSDGFIRSAGEGNEYSLQGGTSQAAPHVAGAILLLKEAFPYLSGEDLKLALYYSARDLGEVGEDNDYGNGLIDVFAAYEYLLNEGNAPIPPVAATNDVVLLDVATEKSVLCRGGVEVSVDFENATTNNLTSLAIKYYLTNNSSNVQTLEWAGNLCVDCITSVELPILENLSAGKYELIVEIENPNNQTDERTRNNIMRHTFEVLNLEDIDARINNAYSNTICRDAKVLLESERPLAENQKIEWYTSLKGGLKVGEGNPFLTDELNVSDVLYADIATTYFTGKASIEESENIDINLNKGGLKFDAIKPFKLVSVKVYAEEAGGRFIKLLDADGNTMQQKIVRLDTGEQRVQLLFDVPIGEGYELALTSGKALYHSNSGARYPYEVDEVLRITRSSIAPFSIRYLFFYDWEVSTSHGCGRTAVPININVNQTASPVFISASADTLTLQDGATFEFKQENANVQKLTWHFGDGSTSTENNPIHTYQNEGTYQVVLTLEDQNGCVNSEALEVVVLDEMTTSTKRVSDILDIILYPNPASDFVTIQTNDATLMQVQVIDMLGEIVQQTTANSNQLKIDCSSLPNGVYYILINLNEQQVVEKMIKTE